MDVVPPSVGRRKPLLAFVHVSPHLSERLFPAATRTWVFVSDNDLLPVELLMRCFGLESLALMCPDGSTLALNYNTDTGFSRLTCAKLGLKENKTGFLTALFTGVPEAHKIFACDGCRMAPIVGIRHKCVTLDGCDNFDLCEQCFAGTPRELHDASHRFVPFPLSQRVSFVGATNVWEPLQCALIAGGSLPALGIPSVQSPTPSLAAATTPDASGHTPGCYQWISYLELLQSVLDFAAGLSRLPWSENTTSLQSGVRRHVGICADNSIEWVIADMACKYLGFVSFTMHVAFSDTQLCSALSLSGCDIVITSDLSVTMRILNISSTPLQHIIQIRGKCPSSPVPVSPFAQVQLDGHGICVPPRYLPLEALSTVIFTSGTTGQPKGVMITYGLELSLLSRGAARGFFSRSDVSVIFEPLAWMTARDDVYVSLIRRGCALLYEPARHSLEGLFAELPLLQPTHFKAVPLIYNKLYLEFQALTLELKSENVALQRMRELKPFGGRLEVLVTGGAKTAPKVLEFLRTCFISSSVVDAMGTTEVGAVLNDNRLVSGAQAKLIDVPSLGYFSSGRPSRGELVVKTATMTPGYFRDDRTTSDKFDSSGWFHTGDIVEKVNHDEYVIIDRVASFIKLAFGEFVSPSHIEESLVGIPNINQLCVCGGIGDAFLVAVVLLEKNVTMSETEVLTAFLHTARKRGLSVTHLPRRVVQTDRPFSVLDGTLTPTGKLNRIGVARRHKVEFEALTTIVEKSLETESLVDKVSRISAELLGTPLSSYRESLREAGFHSELSVRLAHRLEIECGFKGSLSHVLSRHASPESIAAALQATTPGTTNLSDEELFNADRAAVPILKEAPPVVRTVPLSSVLITGCTGFVGRYLLRELMSMPKSIRLVCVVRALSNQEARSRVEFALSQIGHWKPLDPAIEVFAGNLEEKQFGLSSQSYWRLVCSIQAIIHCAAKVNWVLPYSALRAPNVVGTKAILEFSTEGCPKEIHHISTISAAPTQTELSKFSNEYPFIGLKGGYVQSKWMSELLLRCHARSGLAIYRLGMCAPANNGFCVSSDMIPRFLAGVAVLGAGPNVSGRMEMTSVDSVASLIVRAIASRIPKPSTVCTFHVVNDRANFIGWRDMIHAVSEATNTKILVIPHSHWVERVIARDSPLRPLASFVSSPAFFRDSRSFDNQNFKSVIGIDDMPTVDLASLTSATQQCLHPSRFCGVLSCWQDRHCVLHPWSS